MAKKKILDGDGTHGSKLAGKHSGVGEKAKVDNHGAGSAESCMKTVARAIIEGYSRKGVALNADLPDDGGGQYQRILQTIRKLRGSAVRHALPRIVEEYNKGLPNCACLTAKKLGGILYKELGITTWTQTRAKTAAKHDNGKPRFDLIPPGPLEKITEAFNYGAGEYGERNWELGMSWGRVFGAIQRHLWAFWGGEDKDKESGLPHLASAGWGIMALLEYSETHKEFDDRPRKRRKYKRRKPAGAALLRKTAEAGNLGPKSAREVGEQAWSRAWENMTYGFVGKAGTGAKSNETNQKHNRKDKKRQGNGAVSMPAV